MSDIKNQYGEVVYRIEGNRINDKYGEWKYEIRDNYIYDRYGARQFEIKGEYLYDTSGSRLGEMKDLAVLLGDTGESDNSGSSESSGDVTAPSSDVGSLGGPVSSGVSGSGNGCALGCLGSIAKTNGVFRALTLALGGGGVWGCVYLMFSNWTGRIGIMIGFIVPPIYLIGDVGWSEGLAWGIISGVIVAAILGTVCAIMEIVFRATNWGGRVGLIIGVVFTILALVTAEFDDAFVSRIVAMAIFTLVLIIVGSVIGGIIKKIIRWSNNRKAVNK